MNANLQPREDGTAIPAAATLVLSNRPIGRNGRLSTFGDDRWSFTEGFFEAHVRSESYDWTRWPDHLRLAGKTYAWVLVNHEPTEEEQARGLTPLSLRTVIAAVRGLQPFIDFMDARSITAFHQVATADLETYVRWVADSDRFSRDRQNDLLWEIRRLWLYRHLLPPEFRLPPAPPWNGKEPRELLGTSTPVTDGNRTPRVDERVMAALLGWAIRFIDDFSIDILPAAQEYQRLRMTDVRRPDRPKAGPLGPAAERLVRQFRKEGRALPGRRGEAGLEIDLNHTAKLLGTRHTNLVQSPPALAVLRDSGLPIAPNAELVTALRGTLDGRPWLDENISYSDLPTLANMLTTSCLIVTAYLSGMRPAEVLNLRRGCLSHDAQSDLWTLTSKEFKGVRDETGAKKPEGQVREHPWVVAAPAARAIRVMEQLHDRDLIFPRTGVRRGLNRHGNRSDGLAMSEYAAARSIGLFCEWVNQYCEQRGRPDSIPEDRSRQRITLSRFRRTLAWHICRRPRGLVAASIQYGHVLTTMTVGYAGNAASGFPDDHAFERFLARLDDLSDASRRLESGEHVSGPSADIYRRRVAHAMTEFAGVTLTSGKQARALLANPTLQVVQGTAMACVTDPSRALCGMKTREDDPTATPDLTNCQPNACANVARTDSDIAVIRHQAARLRDLVADDLAPPLRVARERAELDRLQAIIDEHERSREGHDA